MTLLIERKELKGWAGEVDRLHPTQEPRCRVALNRSAIGNLNERAEDETSQRKDKKPRINQSL
jgi:hypothetical protein